MYNTNYLWKSLNAFQKREYKITIEKKASIFYTIFYHFKQSY